MKQNLKKLFDLNFLNLFRSFLKIKTFSLVICTVALSHQTVNAQMFWNQAAQFSGSSSYVAVPNSNGLGLVGNFTIEAWINPSTTAGLGKGIVSKSTGLNIRYAMRLFSGKIFILTNAAQRIVSKSTIQANKWTHVSSTYNFVTGVFKIFINGILDTSATIPNALPQANTDSLYIGTSGPGTEFSGQLDEVRLWSRELSSTEISNYFRTSLEATGGIYRGLILSMPFQKQSALGNKFSVKDFSGSENDGNARNVTAVDNTFKPLNTISQNECVEFGGNDDYLAANDTSTINPSTGITLECWVFPRSSVNCNLITKGNSYSLFISSGSVLAKINGSASSSIQSLPLNRWSHISFTYNAQVDSAIFYINFNTPRKLLFNAGNINSSTDSLFIGGVPGPTDDFNGFIDEVRISNYAKTQTQIDNSMYKSIDASNDPGIITTDISYGLDGSGLDNSENGGPRLYFRNNAKFSNPATKVNQPESPVNRNIFENLSAGFYVDITPVRIPSSGTSGQILRNNPINLVSETITDVNLFVMINHSNANNLEIVLTSPHGDSVKVFDNNNTNSADNNLNIIFDDDADSTLTNGHYSSFYSNIKPANSLNSVFTGQSPFGNWRLKIRDEATNDTGMIYAWGIQFNNQNIREKDLFSALFIQGFYNLQIHRMNRSDTAVAYLRSFNSPYNIVDSAKALFNEFGVFNVSFRNASNNTPYFLEILHRNSIETWSSSALTFRNSEASLDFTNNISNAFGNNQTVVDAAFSRNGFFNGDVSRDGTVDLSDLALIDNDLSNFVSGYVNTDLTGDDNVDLSDAAIADNNASNFVSVVRP